MRLQLKMTSEMCQKVASLDLKTALSLHLVSSPGSIATRNTLKSVKFFFLFLMQYFNEVNFYFIIATYSCAPW